MKKEALGIDISKESIDAYLHIKNVHKVFKNTNRGFGELIKWVNKQSGLALQELVICFENTGLYSMPLAVYLEQKQMAYCMVSALEIKKSLGLTRGKNDQVDARRIAEYAFLRKEQLEATCLPSKQLMKLQKLLSLRSKLVSQRAGFQATVKETKRVLKQSENKVYFDTQKKMMTQLSKQIANVEKEIKATIVEDQNMSKLYGLITSVKGIGMVVGANMLVMTKCFTSFENSRKFACYAGIAPFAKQSGSSLKKRSAVSHYANKKIKVLLNLAASSAVQYDPELKQYYERRIEQGKSPMSTLNIVRNKLVHRVFAVVNRQEPYVTLYKWAS